MYILQVSFVDVLAGGGLSANHIPAKNGAVVVNVVAPYPLLHPITVAYCTLLYPSVLLLYSPAP